MTASKALLLKILSAPEEGFVSNGDMRISYKDFAQQIHDKVNQWRLAGVGSKTIILIPSGQSFVFFIEIIAAWLLGSTAVPIDKQISLDKREHLLTVLNAPAAIFSQELLHSVYWENDNFLTVDAILFTSGSSGVPKGVLHTLDNLIGNALALINTIKLVGSDHLFFNIPYHFTSAICHFLSAFITGASLTAIENKLFSAELHKKIDEVMPSCFGGSPMQLLWLSNSSIAVESSIKWFMSSGDDLPVSTIQSLKHKYPESNVLVVYGLTEIGGRGCVLLPEFTESRLGSVGKPIRGLTVTVRDENLNELPVNEIGNIYFSGDYLLLGFVEARHNSEITKFGYSTGDVGYLDNDGFLFLHGRSDDVFKVAGKKVSGLVIRRAIMESNYVDDAVVIPKKDELLGSIPVALIVPKDNQTFNKGILLKFLRERLPSDNIPKSIITIQKIPRTDSGKIIKRQVIDLLNN